jgi:broad specificity phosphatase PhoE
MGVLLLVRHGQASFGAEDYDVLSEAGVAQSTRLGEALAAQGLSPSAVLHGTMRRQRDTAQAMVAAAGWDVELETDPRWDEFGHLGVIAAYAALPGAEPVAHDDGELDRRSFQHIFEQATTRWASAAHDDEYDESYSAFVGRVDEGLREVAQLCESGSNAVVVTSGGAIAAVCARLVAVDASPGELSPLWQRFNAVLVNAGVTRVLVGSSGPRLLSFNEHSHLDRGDVTYR